jgi:hypothetical protein
MHDAPLFTAWSNFYVITGSSSAALTGLMFVAVTIVASRRTNVGEQRLATSTFSTPTVVHFCAAFLISGLMSAPWLTLLHIKAALAIAGVTGLLYVGRVMLRTRLMTAYHPDLEDWICNVVLPILAYVVLVAAGLMLQNGATPLFAVAGATLLLIFVGIHNAWDVVTYIAIEIQD